MADIDELIDALDHIIRVCRASRQQSRRIRWIAERARCAIEGTDDWDEIDLPRSVQTDSKKVWQLKRKCESLQAQLDAWKIQHLKTVAALAISRQELQEGWVLDMVNRTLETDSNASIAEIETRAVEEFKNELVKSVKAIFRPHVEGVCAVVTDRLRQ